MKFLSSQLFANLLLFIAVVVAFVVGYRQIYLNDVVEIFAAPGLKQILNVENDTQFASPIIKLQNTGIRIVYLDKYIFNGTEYLTYGQVLPPTYSGADALYWIDLPAKDSGITHVSLNVYYHDLDLRYWKSEVIADLINQTWKVSSLPRVPQ